MTIPQHDTDLRRCGALLGELADVVDDLLRRGLEPLWRGAAVGDCGGGYAFAVGVEASHFGDGLRLWGRGRR